MTCGPDPVRTREPPSAKVTSRASCRPFLITQCPRIRSASRPGLVWACGRLGHRVDDHGPPPPTWAAPVADLAADLDDLRGVREPEPADRDGLEGAQLDASRVAWSTAVRDPPAVLPGAPQGLGVDRDLTPTLMLVGTVPVGKPRADHRRQQGRASRRTPSAARTGWRVSWAHSAIAVKDRTPARTAAVAMARIATSGWRRPRPARGSPIVAR
jgi:hypothetical protein